MVAYDNDGFTNHFCEGSGVYDESDTVTLDDTYGQREYSIQLEIDSCDTPLYSGSHVSAKGRDCGTLRMYTTIHLCFTQREMVYMYIAIHYCRHINKHVEHLLCPVIYTVK